MTETIQLPMAPELLTTQWFNTTEPPTLAKLRGKIVVIEAFQMLCPGCVTHGLPQAMEIAETFSSQDVAVIGLHSVFEHHDAMPPVALEAFLYEYGIKFPVGIDAPPDSGNGPIPKTMQAYSLRGTPTLVVIDRQGRLRINHLGQTRDMRIAVEISKLVFEDSKVEESLDREGTSSVGSVCTAQDCTA